MEEKPTTNRGKLFDLNIAFPSLIRHYAQVKFPIILEDDSYPVWMYEIEIWSTVDILWIQLISFTKAKLNQQTALEAALLKISMTKVRVLNNGYIYNVLWEIDCYIVFSLLCFWTLCWNLYRRVSHIIFELL
jgi:hypothetical protein